MPTAVYVDLRPVMNPWPYVVYEGASLSRQVTHTRMTTVRAALWLDRDCVRCSFVCSLSVYRLYRGIGIRHLPVIDIDNKVVGILCRKELRTGVCRVCVCVCVCVTLCATVCDCVCLCVCARAQIGKATLSFSRGSAAEERDFSRLRAKSYMYTEI